MRRTALLIALLTAAAHGQDDERGLTYSSPDATPGYTLVSPLLSSEVFLVDSTGEIVHAWDLPPTGSGSYLLPNGNLLGGCEIEENETFHGGGRGGLLIEVDWDGELVWEYLLSDDERCLHHDMTTLPNGNVLAIAWERKTPEEARAAGRDPEHIGEEGLWPDYVIEIRPEYPSGGEVVWEWHAWDHLIQDRDPRLPNYGSIPDHPERIDIDGEHRDVPPISAAERERLEAMEREMSALGYAGEDEEDGEGAPAPASDRDKRPDWLHTNAIDYHAELDLIVLSTPHFGEVWVIDHSTTTEQARGSTGGRWGRGGDLLYRWGNPRTYGAGTDADQRFFYQHNPTWIPGDGLRLLVYNNGGGRADGSYSSLEELVLPFDPERGFVREAGAAFGPTDPAWSYEDRENFFSPFISGCQRLPNGNTLACEGTKGRVFEVTPAGEIVWDFSNPYIGNAENEREDGVDATALFRAPRYPLDYAGVSRLAR